MMSVRCEQAPRMSTACRDCTVPLRPAVRLSPHVVRLRPAPHCRTPILAYSLTVTPGDHFINWQQDPFGNHVARLVFPEPARQLTITVDLVADLAVVNPFDFFVEEAAARYPFTYDAALAAGAGAVPLGRRPGPVLDRWMQDGRSGPVEPGPDGQAIVDFLVELNRRVLRSVAYTTRMEPGVQTPDETLEKGLGIVPGQRLAARAGPAPARPGRPVRVGLPGAAAAPTRRHCDGPRGTDRRFHRSPRLGRDLPARARAGSVWTPPRACWPGRATSPSCARRTPRPRLRSRGPPSPCEVTFEYSNTVRRLLGPPRVTLPYSEEQWEHIDALG